MIKSNPQAYAYAAYMAKQGQAIPENEQARHAGNMEGIYKDKATTLFGDGINPNIYSIGIEMEPLTFDGDFSPETYSSAVNLASSLCNKINR